MLLIKKKKKTLSLYLQPLPCARAMFLKAVILRTGMAGYLARGLEFGKKGGCIDEQ